MRDGLAVVVSPLISLMKDQVDTLVGNGVPAAGYHSALDARSARGHGGRDSRRAGTGCSTSRPSGSWARAATAFSRSSGRRPVSFIAIDEAHCISQWGHDFRPEYRQLAQLRDRWPDVSLHAYTATATARVRRDIVAQLGLRAPVELVGSFDRPNLVYRVLARATLKKQIQDVLARHAGHAGIIYCQSRRGGRRARELAASSRRARRAVSRGTGRRRPGIGIRTRSSTKTSTSSWRPSRSAWGSIDPTSGSSSMPARRNRSSTISRSPAARAATASRPSAC